MAKHRKPSKSPRQRPQIGPYHWPEHDIQTSSATVRIERDLDRPRAGTLWINNAPSSYLDLDDPEFLAFEYMQVIAAVLDVWSHEPVRAIHLGAAGCSLARYVHHCRPGSRQIGIDIDDELLRLVREWFDLPRAPHLRLRCGDALQELQKCAPESADVIIRDVFAGDQTPAHLTGVSPPPDSTRAPAPTGIYLANIADRPPLSGTRAETAALVEGWSPFDWTHCAVIAESGVLKGRRYGNLILAATRENSKPLDDVELIRAIRRIAIPMTVLTGATLQRFVTPAASSNANRISPAKG